MDLYSGKDIRALLGRHGFRFSKSMGRDFLTEGWVLRNIAETSDAGPGAGALETDFGTGPLTAQLVRQVAKVVTTELDRTLYPILAETLAPYPNAEAVPGDAMKLDLTALVSDKFSGLTAIACADLPYNIIAPVPTALIRAGCLTSITVMTRREVVLRIHAAPGSSDCGVLFVFCQYHAQLGLLFEVGLECFLLIPKVISAVTRLALRSVPPQNLADDSFLSQAVRASFAQRRKTLLNGLSSVFGSRLSENMLRGTIEAVGPSADIWGERLGIPKFTTLVFTLQNRL